MTPRQAALIEPAAVAAYGVDRGRLQPGQTVLITGAGPIGSLAALYALAGGARRVVDLRAGSVAAGPGAPPWARAWGR